jgi:hypothetical protein
MLTSNDHPRADRVRHWCALAGFPVQEAGSGRLQVALDPGTDLVITIDLGEGDEPLRLRDHFTVAADDLPGLSTETVQAVILGRSGLIDGRLVPPSTVETVAGVYPDGLDRHTFMTALYELQKVRDLVRRAAAGRAVDAVTLAELERLVCQPEPS